MPDLVTLQRSVHVNESSAGGYYAQSANFRVSADDDILVTWFSGGSRYEPGPQRSRSVDGSGELAGPEFATGSPPAGVDLSEFAAVQGDGRATLLDGGYAVARHEQGRDGSSYGIVAQVFNADGSARSHEFVANNITAGEQSYPWVMAVDQDLFMITWGPFSGHARLFHSSGRQIGTEFSISGNVGSGSYHPAVHLLDDYRFVSMNLASGNLSLNYYGINRDAIGLGTAADETLRGRGEVDAVLAGFGADDMYLVDSAGDEVQEWAGEGKDWVLSPVDYRLLPGQEIERLSTDLHVGTNPIKLTGNELSQLINGNAGNNVLDGGGGGDTLAGLGGDDMYFVRNARDVISEAAGAGFDHVLASVSYKLTAGQQVERLSTSFHAGTDSINLTGNDFGQLIHGNAGANTLDGGGGGDALIGLAGNDQYLVRDAHDRVIEAAGQGQDWVLSAVDYRLLPGQEIERLSTDLHIGTNAIKLTGNELSQLINGNAGNNVLDGGGGGDTLAGLGGDDMYFVRNARDVISEGAGAGSDHVLASVSYRLTAGQQVERLSTSFHAGTDPIDLTGNDFGQLVYGNAGANTLDGGGGGDTLIGLGGNDRYFVGDTRDTVLETVGGGTDRILAAVDYRLSAGSEVEILSTTWNAGTETIDLAGNALQQAIYGNAGDNILAGGGAKDSLIGLGGADRFLFDHAPDTEFAKSWDALDGGATVARILDFDVNDRILLDGDVFGLIPGGVPAGAFAYGTVATEASQRFLYDQTSQALLFDPDGVNGASAKLICFIQNPFYLDSNFLLVI